MRLRIPRSRQVWTLVAAGSIALVVPLGYWAAPFSGTPAATAVAATVSANTAPIGSSKLLRTADLPAGWRQVDSQMDASSVKAQLQGVSVSPESCRQALKMPSGYQASAHRVFRKGSSQYGPYLGQGVARYSTTAAARAAVARAKNAADKCRQATVNGSRGSATVSVKALSTPNYGDQRVGFQIDASISGVIPAQGQVIVVRKGRHVTVVGQGGVGSVSTAVTKSATAKAAARL